MTVITIGIGCPFNTVGEYTHCLTAAVAASPFLPALKDEDSSRDIGVARLALAGNWTILRSTDIPEEVGGVSIPARKSRVSTPRIR